MKPSSARLVILVLIPFAGCLHPLRAPEPSTSPIVDVAPTLDLALPDTANLKKLCLGRAMSAAYPLPFGASEEEIRKIAFKNYYNAFRDAEEWLKSSQSTADVAMAHFPEEKRIVDVEETFFNVDEKQSMRRLIVKLSDGSKTTIESRFDRMR